MEMMVKSPVILREILFYKKIKRSGLKMQKKELLEFVGRIEPADKESAKKARFHQDNLTKPQGSLGALEDLAVKLAAIYRNPLPAIPSRASLLFAADHGVVEEGVSAYPQEVTLQMLQNFVNGGAGINVFCRFIGAELFVVDVGVAGDLPLNEAVINRKIAYGTENFTKGPAMSEEEALLAIETGMDIADKAIKEGAQLLATGEMGIGNTTSSAAITALYSNFPIERIVGKGSGLDDKGIEDKISAIKRGIEVNQPDPRDPLDVLQKIGGLEIGAMMGVFLKGAMKSIPVVMDGLISTVAALLAFKLNPLVAEYLIAGHLSEEPSHALLLKMLDLEPLLRLKMRLGEGTGAVLSFSLIDASLKIMQEMATFEEAGVSNKK